MSTTRCGSGGRRHGAKCGIVRNPERTKRHLYDTEGTEHIGALT
jgi:hypothetical protein